jgi:Protein of unknown function (DUF3224)
MIRSFAIVVPLLLGGTPAVSPAPLSSARHHHSDMQIPVMHARGTFDVQVVPLPADAYADGTSMGRMSIDKQLHGDLTGTGKGQMLTGMGSVKGSAAYSAMERITGTVNGQRGSFMLQHTGIVSGGSQSLVITIVPDSGTEQLSGISGTFTIVVEGKQHSYDLAYTLPTAP